MAVTAVSVHGQDAVLITTTNPGGDGISQYAGEQYSHANAGKNVRWAIEVGPPNTFLISVRLAQDVLSAAQLRALTLPTGEAWTSPLPYLDEGRNGYVVSYSGSTVAGKAYLNGLSQGKGIANDETWLAKDPPDGSQHWLITRRSFAAYLAANV